MASQQSLSIPRILPFRKASAGTDRTRLFDRMASRPVVSVVPTLKAGPLEGQDALLSGMTRSLHRRLSGLNFPVAMTTADQKVA